MVGITDALTNMDDAMGGWSLSLKSGFRLASRVKISLERFVEPGVTPPTSRGLNQIDSTGRKTALAAMLAGSCGNERASR